MTTSTEATGSSSGQIAAIVGGSLLAIIAAVLLAAGAGLAIAYTVDRDADGYFSSPTERLSSPTPAVTGEGLDLGDIRGEAGEWLIEELDVSARITAAGEDGAPVFVGIAREADLDAYLDGIAHDEVDRVDDDHVSYRRRAGVDLAPPPAQQDIWVRSAQGRGPQQVTWRPSSGRWAAAVMRPDGRPGVAAEVSVAGRTTAVLWIAVVLAALGLGAGATAGILIWLGARSSRDADPDPESGRPAVPA